MHYLLGHLGWAAALALGASLLSLAYSIAQVRTRLEYLRKIREQEQARVPALSQELKDALGDAGTKDVLAPSRQPNSTSVSGEQLKQGHMGAQ